MSAHGRVSLPSPRTASLPGLSPSAEHVSPNEMHAVRAQVDTIALPKRTLTPSQNALYLATMLPPGSSDADARRVLMTAHAAAMQRSSNVSGEDDSEEEEGARPATTQLVSPQPPPPPRLSSHLTPPLQQQHLPVREAPPPPGAARSPVSPGIDAYVSDDYVESPDASPSQQQRQHSTRAMDDAMTHLRRGSPASETAALVIARSLLAAASVGQLDEAVASLVSPSAASPAALAMAHAHTRALTPEQLRLYQRTLAPQSSAVAFLPASQAVNALRYLRDDDDDDDDPPPRSGGMHTRTTSLLPGLTPSPVRQRMRARAVSSLALDKYARSAYRGASSPLASTPPALTSAASPSGFNVAHTGSPHGTSMEAVARADRRDAVARAAASYETQRGSGGIHRRSILAPQSTAEVASAYSPVATSAGSSSSPAAALAALGAAGAPNTQPPQLARVYKMSSLASPSMSTTSPAANVLVGNGIAGAVAAAQAAAVAANHVHVASPPAGARGQLVATRSTPTQSMPAPPPPPPKGPVPSSATPSTVAAPMRVITGLQTTAATTADHKQTLKVAMSLRSPSNGDPGSPSLSAEAQLAALLQSKLAELQSGGALPDDEDL